MQKQKGCTPLESDKAYRGNTLRLEFPVHSKTKQPGGFLSGFTLIEIMVVVLIIGLLATLVAVNVIPRKEEANRVKACADIKSLETALKLYYLDNHGYPTTEQGLKSLVEQPTIGKIPCCWKQGGYIEGGHIPKDPWDNDYVYISPAPNGSDYEIISYGADGKPGGEGKDKDITSLDTGSCQ
jgi:general secretion pathway protein G